MRADKERGKDMENRDEEGKDREKGEEGKMRRGNEGKYGNEGKREKTYERRVKGIHLIF
jgi:hypothetical protein